MPSADKILGDLAGKEIWLVQIPKDLDISDAQMTDSELRVADKRYTMREASIPLESCKILLERPGTDSMHAVAIPEKAFAVSRAVSVPRIDYANVTTPKPLVPQKPNLRLRHFATGYGSAANSQSDDTELAVPRKKARYESPATKTLETGDKPHKSQSKGDKPHKPHNTHSHKSKSDKPGKSEKDKSKKKKSH